MLKKASISLKEKRKELSDKYFENQYPSFLPENTGIIDDYFREGFQNIPSDYAIVALGGFGRSEQCVLSDVDIMFLFGKKGHKEVSEIIKVILYPLWDIGLDIGYSTRTIYECISLSGQDLEILTSLLDSRFICGDSTIFNKLKKKLAAKSNSSQTKFVNWIKNSSKERHTLFGDASSLIEPDLKNGRGGLRDYHAMLWIGKIKGLINSPSDLLDRGFLSKTEYESLIDSLSFIWKVRNLLHIIAKRKCDQLFFVYHSAIAKKLGFKAEGFQNHIEIFIGTLHEKMETIKNLHSMFLSETGNTKSFFFNKTIFKRSNITGIKITKGMLEFQSPRDVKEKPILLMKIFLESANLDIPISSASKRIISESANLIRKMADSNEAVSVFEKAMRSCSDGNNPLTDMLSTGFLSNFIPEFKKIMNIIQYNQYHRYAVDRHSIMLLQKIKNFIAPDNYFEDSLYGELYGEIKPKKVLLWAALLHDIGKGEHNDEHSVTGAKLADKILKKKGISSKNREMVYFLIENHLFLINAAKRRDIEDEETAIYCARKIQSINMLKMLYLLTIADSLSTGPNAWNSWTEDLLRQLFFKILEVLKTGNYASVKKEKALEKKRTDILSANSGNINIISGLAQIIESMSNRYLMNNSEKKIIGHLDLLHKLKNNASKFEFCIKNNKSETKTATLCGEYIPGFFSKIAGVFTLNNYDILDAQIYSWGKKNVLDIFTISPLFDNSMVDDFKKIESDLTKALKGELNLTDELHNKSLKPSLKKKQNVLNSKDRIEIDNLSSSFFTIIEIYTKDSPGLLFSVTNTLYECGADIVYSKISTHVDQVVDIFYVREINGFKILSQGFISDIKDKLFKSIKKNI